MSEFMSYPTNRTTGFFDNPKQVAQFVRHVTEYGFAGDDVNLIGGPAGLDAIDIDGTQHGLTTQALRLMQKVLRTGEWELLEKAQLELEHGHFLVSVLTQEEAEKDEVVRLMKAHGAHDIKYFNTMYVEHFKN